LWVFLRIATTYDTFNSIAGDTTDLRYTGWREIGEDDWIGMTTDTISRNEF